MDLKVTADKVDIQGFEECNTKGSLLRPIHSTTMVKLDGQDLRLLIWGGQDLVHMQPTSNLVILKKIKSRSKKMTFDVTTIQPATGGAISTEVQIGDVPQARFGHTFTRIETGLFLLHGGITKQRQTGCIPSPFKTTCEDGKFYLLDIRDSQYNWEVLNIPELQPRAFHTATLHHNKIYIIGGTRGESSNILPFHEITIFHIDSISNRQFHLSSFHLSSCHSIPSIQLTYHDAISSTDNSLCVYGGFRYEHPVTKPEIPKTSRSMFVISLAETQIHVVEAPEQTFETAGHSMLKLDSNCIMVCGGSSKHMFMYTDRNISTLEPCALGDGCTISTQNLGNSRPKWVFCDGACKDWYHILCLNLAEADVPDGKYCCPKCTNVNNHIP